MRKPIAASEEHHIDMGAKKPRRDRHRFRPYGRASTSLERQSLSKLQTIGTNHTIDKLPSKLQRYKMRLMRFNINMFNTFLGNYITRLKPCPS